MKTSFVRKFLTGPYAEYVRIGIILILGSVAYANSLDVPIQLDDQAVVRTYNQVGFELFSIDQFNGRSRWFADVTFLLNRYFHGEWVPGFHLVNFAIHISTAITFYLLLVRALDALKLTFSLATDGEDNLFLRRFIPFAAAAFFVSHPIQTQAVTYITQRYTSLATLLYVCAVFSYLMARLALAEHGKAALRVCIWSLACFISALLAMESKEIAFTIPFMIIICETALFRGRMLRNRFFLVIGAGLMLFMPFHLIHSHGMDAPGNLATHMHAVITETANISRTDYLLTQFRVIATYLRLLIFPINQNLDYDYPVSHSLFEAPVIGGLVVHLTLITLAVWLFVRSHKSLVAGSALTGIPMRLGCLGILWFYLALSVESSFVPIRDVIFEHRIYLPSIGFFTVMVALVAGGAVSRRLNYNVMWVACLFLCAAFVAGTIDRNRIWGSELGMWQDVLKKSPNKARARYNVGFAYYKKYLLEQALPHLVIALELDTDMDEYWNTMTSTISLISQYQGRCVAGFEFDRPGNTDLELRRQWLANNHNSLGLAYEHLGNLYRARESYGKSVKINPAYDLAWYNMALVAARQKDGPAVSSALESLKPINPELEQQAVRMLREQPH